METYLALLLFIVPGFIAKKIYGKLDKEPRAEDNFETTTTSLIYSVFIIAFNYLILNILGLIPNTQILNIINNFNSASFVLGYSILTLAMSTIVAYLWDKLKPQLFNKINQYRKEQKRNTVLKDTVLSESFNDGSSHLVSIEKDGKELFRGLILYINTATKELYIEDVPDCSLLSDIKGKYFDFDKNIQITEY